MNVYHERFAGDVLRVYAGRICQPVVGVYDVTLYGAGDHACDDRVVVDLFKQIVGITARELDTAQVVQPEVIEICIYMVAELEIHFRIHHVADAVADIIPADITPRYRNVIGSEDGCETLLFVAPGFRNHERDVHVAIGVHAFGQTVRRSSETAEDMRREFPTEH